MFLFLSVQMPELGFDTSLHLHAFYLAYVPLLSVESLACLPAIDKAEIWRVSPDLFSIEGEVVQVSASLSSHGPAHKGFPSLALKLRQVLLDVFKSVASLGGHHAHEFHLIWLQRLCVEEGGEIQPRIRYIVLNLFAFLVS